MKEIHLNLRCLPFFAELGRQGENEATRLIFDCSDFITELGEGTAVLLHQRSGDEIPYVAETERNGNALEWVITSADTAFEGSGKAQLNWYVGNTLKKSAVFFTRVCPALTESEETPQAIKTALDIIAEAVAKDSDFSTGRTPLNIADEADENYTENGYDITALADGAYDITEDGVICNPEGAENGAVLEVCAGSIMVLTDGTVTIVTGGGNYYFGVSDAEWENCFCVTVPDLQSALLVKELPSDITDILSLSDGLYYTNRVRTYRSAGKNYSVTGLIEIIDNTHYVYNLGLKFSELSDFRNTRINADSVEPIYGSYSKAETDALIAAAIADVSALIGGEGE